MSFYRQETTLEEDMIAIGLGPKKNKRSLVEDFGQNSAQHSRFKQSLPQDQEMPEEDPELGSEDPSMENPEGMEDPSQEMPQDHEMGSEDPSMDQHDPSMGGEGEEDLEGLEGQDPEADEHELDPENVDPQEDEFLPLHKKHSGHMDNPDAHINSAGSLATPSALRMGESKSEKRVNELLESVHGIVNRLNQNKRNEAMKSFANISIISEKLSRLFVKAAKSLQQEDFRGVAKTARALAEESGAMAVAISEGKTIYKLDETFQRHLGLAMEMSDLYDDILEACACEESEHAEDCECDDCDAKKAQDSHEGGEHHPHIDIDGDNDADDMQDKNNNGNPDDEEKLDEDDEDDYKLNNPVKTRALDRIKNDKDAEKDFKKTPDQRADYGKGKMRAPNTMPTRPPRWPTVKREEDLY